jgi:hypothetical protein
MAVMISTAFNITGPSPVGTIYIPNSYRGSDEREIALTVVNTVGQFNFTFLTGQDVDESKTPRILLTPTAIIGTSGVFIFSVDAGSPTATPNPYATETYQPQNTGFNYLITVPIFLRGATNAVFDIPAGALIPFILTINLEWDTK